MKFKGKGINPEALIECLFCVIFGILLFSLTYTGKYMSFVTPRMKPYLYGLSVLMFFWAVMNARNILKPRYKNRMYHCLILVIPMLILADPPAPPDGSGMIRKYETISLPGAPSAKGAHRAGGAAPGSPGAGGQGVGGQSAGNESAGSENADDEGPIYDGNDGQAPDGGTDGSGQTRQPIRYASQGQVSQSGQAAAGAQGQSGQTAAGAQGQTGQTGGSSNGAQSSDPAAGVPDQEADADSWYTLTGLDTKAKTINVSDDDFYTWMFELGVNPKKYDGYTITMKGFIYREADSMKKNEFALVRLSMWCCAADLTPIGLLVDSDGGIGTKFKENDWVVVTGKMKLSSAGDLVLKAEHIEAAKKPEEEYVYPTF